VPKKGVFIISSGLPCSILGLTRIFKVAKLKTWSVGVKQGEKILNGEQTDLNALFCLWVEEDFVLFPM